MNFPDRSVASRNNIVFRLQVWHESKNHYVDVVLSFDGCGPVTFRPALLGDKIAVYDDEKAALRDAIGLLERHRHALLAILDSSTGLRHSDWESDPRFKPEDDESLKSPEILADDWIIQRAVIIGLESECGNIYVPWPRYTQRMTHDQALTALEEYAERWPDEEFRAHRLRPEEWLAAKVIDRAKRLA
jgi:hypothetical protein